MEPISKSAAPPSTEVVSVSYRDSDDTLALPDQRLNLWASLLVEACKDENAAVAEIALDAVRVYDIRLPDGWHSTQQRRRATLDWWEREGRAKYGSTE